MNTVSQWLAEDIAELARHLTAPESHPLAPAMQRVLADVTPSQALQELAAVTSQLRAKPFPSPLPASTVSRALLARLVQRCNQEPQAHHVPTIRIATRAFTTPPIIYVDCFAPRAFTAEQRQTLGDAFISLATPCLFSWHPDPSLGGGARYVIQGTLVDATLRGAIERLFSSSILSL